MSAATPATNWNVGFQHGDGETIYMEGQATAEVMLRHIVHQRRGKLLLRVSHESTRCYFIIEADVEKAACSNRTLLSEQQEENKTAA